MKIRQIRAFLAVARTGGVRRAAAQLSLTQSTVAKAVSQLESGLGCPLFDRSAMGLRLNAAGQSLLPYAETIVANADRAQAVLAELASGQERTLRIGVTPTLPREILAAAISQFRSRFPAVKIIFSSGFFSECAPLLLTDHLDLALVMTGRHQHEVLGSLAEESLFSVNQGVVCAPDHPVLAPASDLRKIFQESEWLTTRQDELFLLDRLSTFGVTRPRAMTLCDFYAVDALKGANGALSLSPLSVVDDLRYAGRLDALPPERFPIPPLTVSFFHRRAVELSPVAEYMRFSIRKAFEEWYDEKPRRFVRLIPLPEA